MSRNLNTYSNSHRLVRRTQRRAQPGRGCLAAKHLASGLGAAAPSLAPQAVYRMPAGVVREAGMLELLAAEARIAKLEAELAAARCAATTDPLTGALNRRGFAAVCEGELGRARRKGQALALAHLDLDEFKQINDRYGHGVGDLALQHLVRSLASGMRPGDVLCRFGGEEFVILLPETGLDEAVATLCRHLSDLAAAPVPGTTCTLTFSAGVVCVQPEESVEAALQRADAATYTAKRGGRNRIERG